MAIDEKKLIDEVNDWSYGKFVYCFEHEHEYEDWRKLLNECFGTFIDMIEAQSKLDVPDTNVGKWIPCSERLPELFKSVLVTVKTQGGNACYVSERFVINGEEGWSALCGRKPIAWMPLPPAYKGE